MNLITFDDVLDFEPGAAQTKTEVVIAAVSRVIQGPMGLGRSLAFAEATERVGSDGDEYLMLPRYPVHEVVDAFSGDDEIIDFDQYDSGNRWGYVYRSDCWPRASTSIQLTGDRTGKTAFIEVTYSAGYKLPGQIVPSGVEDLPEDIKLAAIEMVQLRMGKRQVEFSGRQVIEESIGIAKIRFGSPSQGISSSAGESMILEALRRSYRRPKCP